MFMFKWKKEKKMKFEEILNTLGSLADEEKQQLMAALTPPPAEETQQTPEEPQAAPADNPEEDKTAENVGNGETAETQENNANGTIEPPPEEPVNNLDNQDADTYAALAARITAQDTALSALAERIDAMLNKLEDKDFGAPAAPPAGKNDGNRNDDDEIMRRYNPRYRN